MVKRLLMGVSAAVLSLTVGSQMLGAQSPEPATTSYAHRLNGPIVFDGMSDEPAWQEIPPLPLTVYEPVYLGAPSQPTEIRIGYDDHYLYVAGRMYDSDPDGIRINTLGRDTYSGDDTFGVIVDGYNDNESAVWFWVTPAGVRSDAALSNDAEGHFNMDWNGFWDTMTEVNEDGWFSEIRIPFSTLGFQTIDDSTVMGITVYRWIGRFNERQLFPAHTPEWSFRRPSRAQDVILEGVRARRPVYFTPYVTGGLQRAAVLNGAETAYEFDNDRTTEAGADLRYSISDNLRLDLSANTDFAQVEADDQQVNLTRFSLFFPEKRQFFQERAGVFEFGFGNRDRLFHSRRIGLNDDGEAIRILGGARLVGRLGEWDVGVIDMQTAAGGGLSSENFGVFRIRRKAFNPNSYLGAMVTSRLGEDGSYNIAYGIDGVVRVFGEDYLTVRWAQAFDDELIDNDTFDAGAAGSVLASWDRRRSEGVSYSASGRWSGSDYRPDLGFVTRTDFVELAGGLQYDNYVAEGSALRRVRPFQLSGSAALRNQDRTVESARAQQRAEVEWVSGTNVEAEVTVFYEDLREILELPDAATVPVGSYTFVEGQAQLRLPGSNLFRTSVRATVGTFYDGTRANVSVGPTWNVSRFFEFEGSYSLDRVRFTGRGEEFTSHIARLRIRAAASIRLSLNALLQYSSTGDRVSANVRFRYNVREGNDLWIVYNEGVNTDLDRETPRLQRSDRRAVAVKYTYTFAW